MSGPKVVRIVTREELIALCLGSLAKLENALDSWERGCRRRDLVSDDDIAQMRANCEKIAALMKDDRFADLQKVATDKIAYLESDLEARIERQIQRQARLRTSTRRLASAAETLLGSLEKSGLTLPPELIHNLRDVQAGNIEDLDKANAFVGQAFAALAPEPPDSKMTQEQLALAKALGKNVSSKSLQDWLTSFSKNDAASIKHIDHYLAQLETEFGDLVSPAYADRLARIGAEPDVVRRRMMEDTLVTKLSTDVKRRRIQKSNRLKLEAIEAELKVFDTPSAAKMRNDIKAAIENSDSAEADRALDQAQVCLRQEREKLAIEARRNAILSELTRRGYEVREGMATILAHDGKLVIRKASDPAYGVEVSGAKGDRFQVRAVAFGDPGSIRDQSRDREMEAIWCSEFEQISASVAKGGGQMVIEQAREIGETPLKIVPAETGSSGPRIAKVPPKTRTRKNP